MTSKNILYVLSLLLLSISANAQVNAIQTAIEKLERAENFSYRTQKTLRQYNADTTISYQNDLWVKSPNDKAVGYLFRMETQNKNNGSSWLNVYNGTDYITLDAANSTYYIDKIKPSVLQNSIIGYLQILKGLAQRKPVTVFRDTTINAITCAHLLITSYDTVINNEHLFTRINVYTDKQNNVPVRVQTISRNRNTGDAITNFFSSFDYSDFQFNQKGIDLASYKIPAGYHLPVEKQILPLLKPGAAAPNWSLADINGKKLNLSDLKGKVVLLNFFFIGCEGAMFSLKPLNDLYKRYQKSGLTIVGLSNNDTKRSVNVFKTSNKIPYPIFGDAHQPFSRYHVADSPTFYFIDKEGKVAEVIVGYKNDFKQNATAIIDRLIGS